MSASTKLAPSPPKYDQRLDQELRTEMERRDLMVHKKGRHIELGGPDFYIVLTAPNGNRYSLTVSNAGALVVTAL